jgi:hypothetical protein
MDALRLDGNAAAGVLREVFGSEMTTALGTCGSCGAVGPVGAVHLYVSAGMVLRCPSCEAVPCGSSSESALGRSHRTALDRATALIPL